MSKIKWESIPESYWPDTDTPWRVSWGFGAFEDFASEEEAWDFYREQKATQKNGWEGSINEPFNAVMRSWDNI